MMIWPSIGVVIPTRTRPRLLAHALNSVLAQDYPGPLRVVVVYDQVPPDRGLARGGDRPVTVIANWRRPGLIGARDTGILALDTDLVAFCDDDDRWLPGKLSAQVRALEDEPGAEFSTCAIEVQYRGRRSIRLAGRTRITRDQLLVSRRAMLHPSGFLVRRASLIEIGPDGIGPDGIGLFAEDAPSEDAADWDLLLRAANRTPIVHVDEPLVRVLWSHTSRFSYEYDSKIDSLEWLLDRHPEIAECAPGAARVYGQMACWSAARGDRRAALRFTRQAVRHNWREPRAAIALAAASRVVRVESVLEALHRHGHGI